MLGWLPPVRADDAGVEHRLLEQVEVTPVGIGARVVVRLDCPMRYAGHFPPGAVTCGDIAGAGDGVRAPAGNAAHLDDVRLEPGGVGLILTLAFGQVVDVSVRPEPDGLGLEVSVLGGPQASRSRQGVVRTPTPGIVEPPPHPSTSPLPARPLPTSEVLDRQWLEARSTFDGGDYPAAVRYLTRLVEYPEHEHRAEAQELLGLARERSGQLAHAKAEYGNYLRSYPEGPAAARVQQRLAALVTLDTRAQVEAVAARDGGMQWSAFGGWSQDYRRDETSLQASDFSTDFLSQSMVITNGDLNLRGQGERFDFQTRLNAGYLYDMLEEGPGNRTRVSLAYSELADRQFGISGRLGRQSRRGGGVLGTFDGLHVGWEARPGLRLNLTTGFPVESTLEAFSGDRRFVSLSVDWSGWVDGLEISPFVVSQRYDGLTDRQAIGGEIRWYAPGRTVVGLLDFDIDYSAINLAMLLGTFQLPARWTVTGTIDHRNSPFLTTRNALAGQPVSSLDELVSLFGEDAVRALAVDRTAQSDTLSLGVSRPIGDRLQWNLDLSGTQVSGMPASGGVPEIPSSGTQLSLGTQLIATSLLRSGDMSVLGLRRYQNDRTTANTIFVSSRFPLWYGFRIGPRLRLDQREYASDGSSLWMLGPSLRLDWHRKRTTVEFEAGSEFASRERPTEDEKTERFWVSLGYRLAF